MHTIKSSIHPNKIVDVPNSPSIDDVHNMILVCLVGHTDFIHTCRLGEHVLALEQKLNATYQLRIYPKGMTVKMLLGCSMNNWLRRYPSLYNIRTQHSTREYMVSLFHSVVYQFKSKYWSLPRIVFSPSSSNFVSLPPSSLLPSSSFSSSSSFNSSSTPLAIQSMHQVDSSILHPRCVWCNAIEEANKPDRCWACNNLHIRPLISSTPSFTVNVKMDLPHCQHCGVQALEMRPTFCYSCNNDGHICYYFP